MNCKIVKRIWDREFGVVQLTTESGFVIQYVRRVGELRLSPKCDDTFVAISLSPEQFDEVCDAMEEFAGRNGEL